MKTYRAQGGPFVERPYYRASEIETICSDELRRVELYPSQPEAIRIERFIEKTFGVCPDYQDLPRGVLGYTEFGPKGVEGIIVSRALEQEGTKPSERRINTTLAHEAGHGLLHAHLFVLAGGAGTVSLFGDDPDVAGPKILCRNDGMSVVQNNTKKRYAGRWWEFQANQAMSALILPQDLVLAALDAFLIEQGIFRTRVFEERRRAEAISLLAEVFNVNPVVAEIRLSQVFPAGSDSQLTL